jgi:hypothetical protein
MDTTHNMSDANMTAANLTDILNDLNSNEIEIESSTLGVITMAESGVMNKKTQPEKKMEDTFCPSCFLCPCLCLENKLEMLEDDIKAHNLSLEGKAHRDFMLSPEEIKKKKIEINKLKKQFDNKMSITSLSEEIKMCEAEEKLLREAWKHNMDYRQDQYDALVALTGGKLSEKYRDEYKQMTFEDWVAENYEDCNK